MKPIVIEFDREQSWMSKIYEDKNRYLKALEKIRDFKTQNSK